MPAEIIVKITSMPITHLLKTQCEEMEKPLPLT
jgi:hypothetical protein